MELRKLQNGFHDAQKARVRLELTQKAFCRNPRPPLTSQVVFGYTTSQVRKFYQAQLLVLQAKSIRAQKW